MGDPLPAAASAGDQADAQRQIVPIGRLSVLAHIELMHMIRKGPFAIGDADAMSSAGQFDALAAMIRPV